MVRLKFPYRSQALRLCIETAANKNASLYLELPRGGQFDAQTGVSIKLDDGKVEDYSAETGSGGDYSTMFVNFASNEHMHEIAPNDPAWSAYPSLVGAIQSSDRAVVQVSFYDGPLVQVIFNVSGFKTEPGG